MPIQTSLRFYMFISATATDTTEEETASSV